MAQTDDLTPRLEQNDAMHQGLLRLAERLAQVEPIRPEVAVECDITATSIFQPYPTSDLVLVNFDMRYPEDAEHFAGGLLSLADRSFAKSAFANAGFHVPLHGLQVPFSLSRLQAIMSGEEGQEKPCLASYGPEVLGQLGLPESEEYDIGPKDDVGIFEESGVVCIPLDAYEKGSLRSAPNWCRTEMIHALAGAGYAVYTGHLQDRCHLLLSVEQFNAMALQGDLDERRDALSALMREMLGGTAEEMGMAENEFRAINEAIYIVENQCDLPDFVREALLEILKTGDHEKIFNLTLYWAGYPSGYLQSIEVEGYYEDEEDDDIPTMKSLDEIQGHPRSVRLDVKHVKGGSSTILDLPAPTEG